MQGDDLVIADSFSPGGTATGGGDDVLNHALDSVLMIGDSATLTRTRAAAVTTTYTDRPAATSINGARVATIGSTATATR